MNIFEYPNSKNEEYKVVFDVLNSLFIQNQFIQALVYFSRKIGYGSDCSGFTFWSDLDDYDKSFYKEKFDGVEFNFLDQEQIINYKDLYDLIGISSKNYIRVFPQKENEIYQLLLKIKKAFDLEN